MRTRRRLAGEVDDSSVLSSRLLVWNQILERPPESLPASPSEYDMYVVQYSL